ncbi:MAG: class I SAM-dependent methyltransferase [Firmicutes bacterium]|nr:class I SAM-dependent methyltransferase [Bacillota bacterium]
MIERLSMEGRYSAAEAAIHINRYSLAKDMCKNKVVLDISCGEGYGSMLLKQWGAKKVVGLDISEEAILNAQKNFAEKDLEFIIHDAMNLDCFNDNYFDMVVSFETIEHLTEPLKFLKEIKRVSKKDAPIIITCPNDYLYYPTEQEFNPYHIKKYTFEDFQKLLSITFKKDNIKYMIGTLAEGFSNILVDNEAYFLQKDMLKNETYIPALKVGTKEIIDQTNCSYYIAFINALELKENIVFYPATIHRWIPDPIDKKEVKILEYKSENEYLKHNIKKIQRKYKKLKKNYVNLVKEKEKLSIELSEHEYLRSQIINSKTYRISLVFYKIYRKIFWWRYK